VKLNEKTEARDDDLAPH